MINIIIKNITQTGKNTQDLEIDPTSEKLNPILDLLKDGLKLDLPGNEFDMQVKYFEKDGKKIIEIKSE